jgi:hypothetical protein
MQTAPTKRRRRRREPPWFALLLGALVVLLVTFPLSVSSGAGQTAFYLYENAIILAGAYVAVRGTRAAAPVMVGMGAVFVAAWVNFLLPQNAAVTFWMMPAWVAFDGAAVVAVVAFVYRRRRIGVNEIAGAVSAYILVGIAFGVLYHWLNGLHPGAFAFNAASRASGGADDIGFLIFSFATLTTVGYGDITPVAHEARMLAVLEAVTGVTYIAVLVGSLVGIAISQRLQRLEAEVSREGKEIDELAAEEKDGVF